MEGKVIQFLKEHESSTPSKFKENAQWRHENKAWLKWSRNIALSLIDYMQAHNLSRSGMADLLGVTPQYVSKLLSGKVNFSFKSVAEIESKLGIRCISVSISESI